MSERHLPALALQYEPTPEEDRKRIQFMEEYPGWHFKYSGFGTYTASKALGADTVHVVGHDLGETVDEARAYEARLQAG